MYEWQYSKTLDRLVVDGGMTGNLWSGEGVKRQ